MTARKYQFCLGPAKAKRPGLEQFVVLACRRWKFQNYGTLNVRVMRSAPADIQALAKKNIADPKVKPYLSKHADGTAADLFFGDDDAAAVEAMAWFTRPDVVETLGIQEVHDYGGRTKKGTSTWGRGWRLGRGWKDWTASDNGGTPGRSTKWIHVELQSDIADLPAEQLEQLWRSLPKP